MLTNIIEQLEGLVLRMEPHRSVRFLNAAPAWSLPKIQRARFRRTLRLAAERSSFYREQFQKRGIDVRRIEHPAELGDFYTTGEDLRQHGAEAFLTKLSPGGSSQIFSTYLGGVGNDIGRAVALDSSGSPYVTGSTSSADFPLAPGSACNC